MGERVTIRRIHELAEENSELLSFLEAKGVMPGRLVTVTEVLDFNQTISLDVAGNTVTLGFAAARSIFVE